MKGGIQKGTTAFDAESLKLDKFVKDAAKELQEEFPHLRCVMQFSYIDKLETVGQDCFGFAPDGGAWFHEDKLIAVFEAKKQGKGGNANERWWDNAVTAQYINKDVIYTTFCTGKGAEFGNNLERMSRKANIMLGENFQFVLKPEGMTYNEIKNQMRDTLANA